MKFPKVMNYSRLVMTEENQIAYALYFRKYLESYKAEGIPIVQLHVQNEIHADQKFPSCVWSGEDLVTFLSEYLIPEVSDITDVWYGTVNGPEDEIKTRHNRFLDLAMQKRHQRCRIPVGRQVRHSQL